MSTKIFSYTITRWGLAVTVAVAMAGGAWAWGDCAPEVTVTVAPEAADVGEDGPSDTDELPTKEETLERQDGSGEDAGSVE